MTDLDKFIETYKQFGIEVKTTKAEFSTSVTLKDGTDSNTTKSDKFGGYPGCSSSLEFDENGEFVTQSFWEG